VDLQLHASLTSALDGGDGQLYAPDALLLEKASKDWNLRGFQSCSGRFRGKKKSLTPAQTQSSKTY